jgi:small-conductance mechanosensitive channel
MFFIDGLHLGYAALLIFGVPLVTFLLAELSRVCRASLPELAGFLRQIQNLAIPTLALWILLRYLAELPEESFWLRMADTALALVGVYVALGGLQLLLYSLGAIATKVPKLAIDLVRLALVGLGAAVVISRVWDADLGQLVAALGVGSVVLGLALQNVIGNIVGGVFLASFRPFAIGDVIKLGDRLARVEQLDWRVVTLRVQGEKILTPTAELNGKTVSIVGPAGNPRVFEVTLDVSVQYPPEQVKAALLEAARDIPQLTEPGAASCFITQIEAGMIRYLIALPISAPLIAGGARSELISRFWYVAQRRGIALGPYDVTIATPPQPDAPEQVAARLRMLASASGFLRPGLPLQELAEVARVQLYRAGDQLIVPGVRPPAALLILEGQAVVSRGSGSAAVTVERLGAGDFYATRGMLGNEASPVQVLASAEVRALAIPVRPLQEALARSPLLARDIETVLEARGQAQEKLARIDRGLRVA